MKKIIFKIIKKIFVIFFVITLTFIIIHILPNTLVDDNEVDDVVREEIIKSYNLDKSVSEQYKIYFYNLMKFNLGKSIKYDNREVKDIIKDNFPISLELGLRVIVLSTIIGFPLGVKAAINKNYSKISKIITTILIAIPSFVIVGLLQYISIRLFKDYFGIRIPIVGFDREIQKILPVISLSIFMICMIIRIVSKKIKEEINKEYVEFALVKGFSLNYVIKNHILKNILPSLISSFIPYMISLITGSFIIENLFGIPGLGKYYISSIIDRDYTVIMGLTIFYTTIVILFLTIMDILIFILDKRIYLKEGENVKKN